MEDEFEDALPIADIELSKDLFRLFSLKQQKSAIEHEIDDLQASLTTEFEKIAFSDLDSDKQYTASVVRGETYDVDLTKLEQFDSAMFQKVTKSTLDKTLFNRALTSGEISSELAGDIITIKERKPWLSINEVRTSTGEKE